MNNENFFIYGLQDELNKLAKKKYNDNEWKNTKTTTEGDTTYQAGVGKRYKQPKSNTKQYKGSDTAQMHDELNKLDRSQKKKNTYIKTKFKPKSKSKKRLQEVVDKKKKQK